MVHSKRRKSIISFKPGYLLFQHDNNNGSSKTIGKPEKETEKQQDEEEAHLSPFPSFTGVHDYAPWLQRVPLPNS